jgi:hypothetical protein
MTNRFGVFDWRDESTGAIRKVYYPASIETTCGNECVLDLSLLITAASQARNGVSMDGGYTVLGNATGSTTGQLISNREIPQNGFDIYFTGNGKLVVPNTTATAGVLYKGTVASNDRFLHNFGAGNTFLGVGSGNLTLTGALNVGVGVNTLSNTTTGFENIAIGWSAGENTTTGRSNTLVGNNAGRNLVVSTYNVFIGQNSGGTGDIDNNVGVGRATLNQSVSTAHRNTAIGNYSLYNVSTGTDNVGVGNGSGYPTSFNGDSVTTGIGNVFLGAESSLLSATQRNYAGAIGYASTVDKNGLIAIGSVNGVHGATLTQQVVTGASTASDSAQLEVTSTTRGFLPPRMTTAEKNAIVAPALGLMVYDTTLNKLCVYTGAWETITSV